VDLQTDTNVSETHTDSFFRVGEVDIFDAQETQVSLEYFLTFSKTLKHSYGEKNGFTNFAFVLGLT
jgi:hypothetical protein